MASSYVKSFFHICERVEVGKRKKHTRPTSARTTESVLSSESRLPEPIKIFPYRPDPSLATSATQKKDHDHDVSRIALASFDTGASKSFISERYITKVLEVPFDRCVQTTQSTGWPLDTLGYIHLAWSWKEEVLPKVHQNTFYVTGPDSPFDVLLGQSCLDTGPPSTEAQSEKPHNQSVRRLGILARTVRAFTCGFPPWRSKKPARRKEKAV